jgi:hypothetical protein
LSSFFSVVGKNHIFLGGSVDIGRREVRQFYVAIPSPFALFIIPEKLPWVYMHFVCLMSSSNIRM